MITVNRLANRFFRYTPFVYNVATLMMGSSLAQGITFAMTPVISRIFSPEHFGIAALFISIANIFSTGASLRYSHAIILPQKDREAINLLYLCVVVAFAVCGAFLLMIMLLGIFMPQFPWLVSLGNWLYVIPIVILLKEMSNVLSSWCIRNKQYKAIAKSEIFFSGSLSGSQTGFGIFLGSSVSGLITGIFLGFVARSGFLFMSVKSDREKFSTQTKWSDIVAVAKVYNDFPFYSMPTGLLRSFSQNLPILMFGYLFSPAIVGFYALANRLIRKPISLIALSVRKVYLQKSAQMRSNNISTKQTFLKTSFWLLIVGAVLFLPIIFFGEELFSFLLGPKWKTSGRYAAILGPWLCTLIVLPPSSTTFIIFRKQALFFRIQLYTFISRICVLWAAIVFSLMPEQTLHLFVGVNVLINIAIIIIAYKINSAQTQNTYYSETIANKLIVGLREKGE